MRLDDKQMDNALAIIKERDELRGQVRQMEDAAKARSRWATKVIVSIAYLVHLGELRREVALSIIGEGSERTLDAAIQKVKDANKNR